MILAWIKYELAGIWPLIWHFGLGAGIVIICVLLWAFTPAFLSKLFPNIQKVLVWVAALTLTIMISTAIGVSLGEKRIQAQWDAALKSEVDAGEQARSEAIATVRAEPPDSVRNDRHNRDNRTESSQPTAKPKSPLRWFGRNGLLGKKRHAGNNSGSPDQQSSRRQ